MTHRTKLLCAAHSPGQSGKWGLERFAGSAFMVAAVLAASTSGTPLAAQNNNNSLNRIGSNESEYAPVPLRWNGFEIYPRIDVELEFNDNIFATDVNPAEDFVVSVVPALTARDRIEDREIVVRAQLGIDTYLDQTIDEQFRGILEGRARLGLGTLTRPYFGASFIRNNSRGQLDDSLRFVAQPIEITQIRSNLGVERDFGPITATLEGDATSFSYSSATDVQGNDLAFGFRDNRIFNVRTQLAYAQSDNQRIFVEVALNQQDFDGPGISTGLPADSLVDRSSSGYRVQVGYQRRLTNLLDLTARAGYLRQNFDDPTFGSVEGLSLEGDLTWRPTPLTFINLRALRAIDQQINPLFSGGLRTEISANVDHELLRNMTLAAGGRYSWIDLGEGFSTIREWNAFLAARYRFNRHWSLGLQAERFQRDDVFGFEQNRAILSARYNF
ncbi:MAG: outer membrane beta-barrel protein [Erythrobacter sp.]